MVQPTMPKVFIADPLDAEGLQILSAAGLELDVRAGLKGDELRDALAQADGCIVRSGTQLTAGLLERAGRLRVVVRAGVGVDNIDVPAATRRGILVMNTPDGNTLSTAEQTLALLFALARHTPAAVQSLKAGKWERGKYTGTQLAGKTLGIIGLGRIGKEVARRALALEMKVVGYDPMLAPERIAQLGIEPAASISELLPKVDVLTVHVPGTEQNRGMIGTSQLAQLRPGSRVINCARGGIIDELALADALRTGHLAGAAADVFEQEPPPAEHPLLSLPNFICTPHLGASTKEAQQSVAIEAATLMRDYLQKGQIGVAVNMAPLERGELAELRPHLDLAWRLGLLLAQLGQAQLGRVILTCQGELAERNTKLITSAFLIGLLGSRLDQPMNLVNAELLTRERGIEVEERQVKNTGDFRSLLRAELRSGESKTQAAATLLGKEYPRLVQLDTFPLDCFLDGNLLVMTHQDRPGLIGLIGTVFGQHQVNIAQMVVGRQTPGGTAIAVLNLDSVPPEEALVEVRRHPAIQSLRLAQLPAMKDAPPWLA